MKGDISPIYNKTQCLQLELSPNRWVQLHPLTHPNYAPDTWCIHHFKHNNANGTKKLDRFVRNLKHSMNKLEKCAELSFLMQQAVLLL